MRVFADARTTTTLALSRDLVEYCVDSWGQCADSSLFSVRLRSCGGRAVLGLILEHKLPSDYDIIPAAAIFPPLWDGPRPEREIFENTFMICIPQTSTRRLLRTSMIYAHHAISRLHKKPR